MEFRWNELIMHRALNWTRYVDSGHNEKKIHNKIHSLVRLRHLSFFFIFHIFQLYRYSARNNTVHSKMYSSACIYRLFHPMKHFQWKWFDGISCNILASVLFQNPWLNWNNCLNRWFHDKWKEKIQLKQMLRKKNPINLHRFKHPHWDSVFPENKIKKLIFISSRLVFPKVFKWLIYTSWWDRESLMQCSMFNLNFMAVKYQSKFQWNIENGL